MDLWDLTKVLARRWYVALPLLLASVVAAVFVSINVRPDYRAQGYLQMLPPQRTESKGPRNPWLDLGIGSLGDAAIVKVTDNTELGRLADRGLSDNVLVNFPRESPLLGIEVVGNSPEQATATVREIIRLLNAEIVAKQEQYGLAPADMITTLTLNDGALPEVVTSKVKRVIVVAGGIGLLITVGGTVAVDALLRRRQRRRATPEAEPASRAEAASPRWVGSVPTGDAGRDADRAPAPPRPVPVQPRRTEPGELAARRDDRPAVVAPERATRPDFVADRARSDATIVLPVTPTNGRDRRENRP
ncbi:hypothetical protein ACFOOK_13520 [Micromonospora krabiensis]|uniref:Capsular polysaccharide biosynthesis protein n=1 Tax=Micromonospora krabiensis TaxID=307121 RepID=A0A1C3N1S0_9ACTN|nr:hypothetical protein [Micromonospora krabiensis]SBV26542.1 Capsular polysaccharide biosynthesis protein [Micromonospora krabiensis]